MNINRTKKIAIICFWDKHATPYLEKYQHILNGCNYDYDVIFWNRTGLNDLSKSDKEMVINIKIESGASKYKKLYIFLKWRQQVLNLIKLNKYNYLIILSTYPAVLLYCCLKNHYRGKYIFDIRDYSMESFLPFRKVIMSLVKSSAFTTISSKAYMKWLEPCEKIIINHNVTHPEIDFNRAQIFPNKNKINITIVGNIRLYQQATELILNMKNSKKYEFGFVGRILPDCKLIEFIRDNGIENIFIEGSFENKDKPQIYQKIDIINSVLGNAKTELGIGQATQIPNRLYDAALFKCPIMVSEGTYLSELVREYSIGFSVNGFDKKVEEKIDNYIASFNMQEFQAGCKRFLNDIMKEEDYFKHKLRSVLFNWMN